MARTLDVYLHIDLAGHLVQDDSGEMTFQYVESWLNSSSATIEEGTLQAQGMPGLFRRHSAGGEQT